MCVYVCVYVCVCVCLEAKKINKQETKEQIKIIKQIYVYISTSIQCKKFYEVIWWVCKKLGNIEIFSKNFV